MWYVWRRHIGFTLVELLVVIAIIAVLAAIIFPVISRVRHSARKVVCLANLQQLHVAMMAYKNDAGGFLPSWCITDPNPDSPPDPKNQPDPDNIITWDQSIIDYVQGETELLVCRANPVAGNAPGGDPEADSFNARAYAMPRYTQWNDGTGNYYGVYVDRIPNPVATILLFEKGSNRPGTWGDAMGENVYQSHGCKSDPDQYRDDMYHFGGKNFLFVDGHASWFRGGDGGAADESIPPPAADASTIDPTNPFSWDSGRRPTGDKDCGPGVCKLPGSYSPVAAQCGDWPPLDWPPAQWPPQW